MTTHTTVREFADDYGRRTEVFPIRRFKSGSRLGVGFDEQPPSHSAWFVYDFSDSKWSKHCGPYSTREQAEEWIDDIRETR